jgi:hypothetical protein
VLCSNVPRTQATIAKPARRLAMSLFATPTITAYRRSVRQKDCRTRLLSTILLPKGEPPLLVFSSTIITPFITGFRGGEPSGQTNINQRQAHADGYFVALKSLCHRSQWLRDLKPHRSPSWGVLSHTGGLPRRRSILTLLELTLSTQSCRHRWFRTCFSHRLKRVTNSYRHCVRCVTTSQTQPFQHNVLCSVTSLGYKCRML